MVYVQMISWSYLVTFLYGYYYYHSLPAHTISSLVCIIWINKGGNWNIRVFLLHLLSLGINNMYIR